LLPTTATYARGLARTGGPLQAELLHIERAIDDGSFLRRLEQSNPQLHALLRDTCAITRLSASDKINVVPAEASAELDCRLLPDRDPAVFLGELRRTLGDETIEIETLMSFTPAASSTGSELYQLLAEECAQSPPGAIVLPSVAAGFTDSHTLRDLGIAAYGFSPLLLPLPEAASIHGHNERVSIAALSDGAAMMLRIVERLVY
jgi:acetylornithine deacetylase/succinyl-diaminopimelate desuccinylase-like protein